MVARLRAFLQSLTTGEAGFMNVIVGSTAFTFGLYRYNEDLNKQHSVHYLERQKKDHERTVDRIYQTQPERSAGRESRSDASTRVEEPLSSR